MGLLVNLTQDGSSDWVGVVEGAGLLSMLEGVLASQSGCGPAGSVVEQCLCVLVNLSTCSERIRNILVHSESIIGSVSSILVRKTELSRGSHSMKPLNKGLGLTILSLIERLSSFRG